MQLSRTKIDRNLSAAQRNMLCDWLLERSAHPTGTLVETGLRELGLWEESAEPSPQSINEWLKKSLSFEIHRRQLREDAEAARVLADTAGNSLAAANKQMLDAMIFDDLRALRSGSEDVDLDRVHDLVLSAARASQAVQHTRKTDADLRIAEAKLSEYQAKDEERKAKAAALKTAAENAKAKGGISEETMKLVEEAIGLL